MNRLSDLMYMQPQQEQEYPLFPDINQQIRYGMQYAQNRVPAGMQKQIIENDPELYGPRPTAPAAPQGGGYKTGSNYVHKPLTQDQVDAWRAKVRAEEAQRRAAIRR